MKDSDEKSADPPRNFSLSVGERVRAMTIGAPAYATRKKSLEDLEERYVRLLVTLHDVLVARQGAEGAEGAARDEASIARDEAAVARALHAKASTFDVKRMNALVAAHNRWYPIEANLGFDVRTGEYVVYGRRWLPEDAWSVERLVECAMGVVAARG